MRYAEHFPQEFYLSHLTGAVRLGHPSEHVSPQLVVVRMSLVDELQPLHKLNLLSGRSGGSNPVSTNLQHLDLFLVVIADVGNHLAKGRLQFVDRTLVLLRAVRAPVLLMSGIRRSDFEGQDYASRQLRSRVKFPSIQVEPRLRFKFHPCRASKLNLTLHPSASLHLCILPTPKSKTISHFQLQGHKF